MEDMEVVGAKNKAKAGEWSLHLPIENNLCHDNLQVCGCLSSVYDASKTARRLLPVLLGQPCFVLGVRAGGLMFHGP